MEYTGVSKEKAVGLIIGMDCVLQTVDRTNLASRNIYRHEKIQATIYFSLKRHTIII